MEAGTELDEGCQPAADGDSSRVDRVDACDAPEERALSAAVPTDDAEELAASHVEAHVVERIHSLGRPGAPWLEETLLDRRRSMMRKHEGLRDAGDGNRGHPGARDRVLRVCQHFLRHDRHRDTTARTGQR